MKEKILFLCASLAILSGCLFAYDANNDGMSDVFADHYGLSQNSAAEDEDKDGLSNLEESKWGTDPNQFTPIFTKLEPYSSNVFVFSFDSIEGKKYLIEFTDDLAQSWTGLGNVQQGNGNTVSFGAQVVGSPGFWRLAHKGDVDFDADGLNFFEEAILQTDDNDVDSDNDYILDMNEYLAGTQPNAIDTPPAVLISPAGGDYNSSRTVTLSNLALPNYIYYTTDGSEPTLFSQKYNINNPISTGNNALVKVRAKVILPDGRMGAESSATYRVGVYQNNSQTVYYGWVTANGAMGYSYSASAMKQYSFNHTYAKKEYLKLGKGWILNGSYQPDYESSPQNIYYGLTSTPANGTGQTIEGFTTDASTFYSAGNFRNYRPVGKGWTSAFDSFDPDVEGTSSKTLYAVSLGFALQPNDDRFLRWIYTTDNKDQFGRTYDGTIRGRIAPIGRGWVTSASSMQADVGQSPSQIYFGLMPSSSALADLHLTTRYSNAFVNSSDRLRLASGWAEGSGMVPNKNTSARTLYYGEKGFVGGSSVRAYSPYRDDFSTLSGRRFVKVGPAYMLGSDSYEIAWTTLPKNVYKGTERINPAVLAHETDFLSYNTSELQGSPPLEGSGWIENNQFIEYIDDDDGLSLADEIAIGTNPNYFDSDGDLIPDGFENDSIHLDPLVPNPLRGEDFDGDGLDTYLELINGSDPDLWDTDGDLVGDGVEVNYGTDPDDISIKPFNPNDFVGPPINDPNCEPIGDLGIVLQSGSSSTGYSVSGTVGDWSDSNSERWRLNFRGRGVQTETFGALDTYDLNLHGGSVFEVSLSHLGSNREEGPDYDYTATITEQSGFILSDIDGLLLSEFSDDQTNSSVLSGIQAKRAYLAPLKSVSFSQSFSGSDAVGPRYRKVALNGRPIPDEKPEQESETEQHAEETYVDAFDLRLHHDTTYLYTPLAASDLVLQVTASATETSWSDRAGLKPHEALTSPFGAAWSSNLCAYVEAVETIGDVIVDPISINVIDESGRSQRFGTTDMVSFFPWPSSRVDKKTWLNKLEGFDTDNDQVFDRLIYTKKYGTQLTYDLCDAWFMYSTDRLEGSNQIKKHRYWRLTKVEDRYNNNLNYNYGNSQVSLIPQIINSTSHPDQFIAIDRSDNCRRVESITDSRGHTIEFNYEDVLVFDSTLTQLTSVDYPDGTTKAYTYETALDVENDDGRITNHFHSNIKQIKDKLDNPHTFHYGFDRTKSFLSTQNGRLAFAVNLNNLPSAVESDLNVKLSQLNSGQNQSGGPSESGSAEYKQMYGLPRQVIGVTLPEGIGSSTFAKTPETMTRYGRDFLASSGTTVTDAAGNVTAYIFGNDTNGIHGEIIDVDDSGDSLSTEWMIYYTQMEVHHGALEGDTGYLGKETFTFDLASGLSLSSITDFSGNTTNWLFSENMPSGRVLPEIAGVSNFMTKWADPTQKTDALGRIETYQYEDFRIMSEINDIHATVTNYSVDSMGRRKSKTVTDVSNTKLWEETYTYADEDIDPLTTHPFFMVEKRIIAFANPSGQTWEQDLVTQYVPDSRGRLKKEIVDPGGLALTTEYGYDLNNNRTSVIDPRDNETTFTYDKLNRLIQVTNPIARTSSGVDAVTTKRFLYDHRGNLVCEVDEENHYTLTFYDALGRKTASVRDMDGLGLPILPTITQPQVITLDEAVHITSDDIVTRFGYNAVSSIDTITDPRGTVVKHFLDDLQRVRHTYTHFESGDANIDGTENGSVVQNSSEKTHTEFLYEISKNTGVSGFSTEGFKPTKVIRHDSVLGDTGLWTLENQFTYDGEYRETQSKTEYKPGSYRTTDVAYGVISSGKETLISEVTDARGKVTRSTRDGLGRETLIQDAYASSDQISTQTKYSSTGLIWQTIDPNGNYVETDYDLAGRAVKVWQPDPATRMVDRPINPSDPYDSPMTETIYDAASNIEATINPRGNRWDFEYDARNRKIKEEAPAVVDAESTILTPVRPTSEIFYDGVGNVIKTIDPRDAENSTLFDRANRPVQVTTSAVPIYGLSSDIQLSSTTHYDANSNILKVTDFEGNATVNFYDTLNRLEATATNPVTGQPSEVEGSPNVDEIVVFNQYDDAGNRIKVTDGEGAETGFRYDGLSRNTKTIWDEGANLERVKTMTFDALLLTQRTDEKNQVTNYLYDDLHRLEDVINVGRTVDNRHYTFDDNSNILTVTHPNETNTLRDTTSTFDALNRVISETSAGVTHSYQYDKAGNRETTTYGQTSRQLVCTYDSLNRLDTMTEGTRVTAYGYNLNGAIAKKVLPNDVTVECSFDLLGRKQSSTNTADGASQPFAHYLYAHDKQGNLREIDESYPLGNLTDRIVFNTYDESYRLKSESISTGSSTTVTTYSYDDGNNRTQKSVTVGGGTAQITSYTYGDGSTASTANSNQLVSFTKPDTSVVSFTYDANGNRDTRTENSQTDTYSYDYENRLLGFNKLNGQDAGNHSWEYDYRTRRVEFDKANSASTTSFSFSGGTSVQEYTSSTTTPDVEFIRGSDYGGGIGGILYSLRCGTPSIKHYNSRGDVVAATNDSGALTWQSQYEAFGTITAESGSTLDRQKSNTKDQDLHNYANEGFRWRDLETGMFFQRDPLGFVDGPNVYTYVVQNPWTKFDPLGLWETGSYWGDVGQVFKGYGNAAVNTAKGIGHVVSHPIQTAQGVGHAVTHPKQTFNALKADVGTKLQSNAGSGEIVGDVLIGIATGGALKAASKTGTVAKVAEKLNVRNKTASATTNVSESAADTAKDFYRKSGFSDADAADHIKGIDLTKPVEIDKVKAGSRLEQHQFDNQGNYYANPSADPNKLGIDPTGRQRKTYEAQRDVNMLKSTAGDVEDWNGSGRIFKGGEQQRFSVEKDAFKEIDLDD